MIKRLAMFIPPDSGVKIFMLKAGDCRIFTLCNGWIAALSCLFFGACSTSVGSIRYKWMKKLRSGGIAITLNVIK
jgi:hypothetical protein